MANEKDPAPTPDDIDFDALPVASRGVVFLLGERVCFEMPELGRIEMDPLVARKVGRALLEGAETLEKAGAGHPSRMVKILD